MVFAAIVALTSPALLLPMPTPPHGALAACSRLRMAPGWMTMQEEAAAAGEPVEEAAAGAEEAAAAAADPKAAVAEEKKALKEKISALEKQLVGARGTLLEQQEAVKDAGEGGYLLLAANFERFRQKSRNELNNQEQVGRVKAAGYLMAFVDAFDELQASAAGAGEAEAKIHSYYGGIYKQFNALLEQWQVKPFEAKVGELADFSRCVTVERLENDAPACRRAGTILEARKRGFTMGDAVIRSAECVTSSGPPPPPPAADEPPAEPEEGAAEGADAATAEEAPPSE